MFSWLLLKTIWVLENWIALQTTYSWVQLHWRNFLNFPQSSFVFSFQVVTVTFMMNCLWLFFDRQYHTEIERFFKNQSDILKINLCSKPKIHIFYDCSLIRRFQRIIFWWLRWSHQINCRWNGHVPKQCCLQICLLFCDGAPLRLKFTVQGAKNLEISHWNQIWQFHERCTGKEIMLILRASFVLFIDKPSHQCMFSFRSVLRLNDLIIRSQR